MQDRDSIGLFTAPSEALDFVQRMDEELLASVYMVASEAGSPVEVLSGSDAADWLRLRDEADLIEWPSPAESLA